jgi:hypothetical protein
MTIGSMKELMVDWPRETQFASPAYPRAATAMKIPTLYRPPSNPIVQIQEPAGRSSVSAQTGSSR